MLDQMLSSTCSTHPLKKTRECAVERPDRHPHIQPTIIGDKARRARATPDSRRAPHDALPGGCCQLRSEQRIVLPGQQLCIAAEVAQTCCCHGGAT